MGYNDIAAPSPAKSSSTSSLAATSPCIGEENLQGVYFSPAVQHGWDTARRKSEFIDSFSAKTESPVLRGECEETRTALTDNNGKTCRLRELVTTLPPFLDALCLVLV